MTTKLVSSLIELKMHIGNKIPFLIGRSDLEYTMLVFFTSVDDDEETEWQHYLRASIETILRVSDVLPEEVLQIVVCCNKFTRRKKSKLQIINLFQEHCD